MTGPNFDQLQTMLNTVKKINIIASGGISSLEDVMKLKDLKSNEEKLFGEPLQVRPFMKEELDFKEAGLK